jgi:hypothetical protein
MHDGNFRREDHEDRYSIVISCIINISEFAVKVMGSVLMNFDSEFAQFFGLRPKVNVPECRNCLDRESKNVLS